MLTPHDREFERFGPAVGADRIGAARRLAADLGAVVLLKGDATVVADPDGTTFVNGTGTPWLATAGTGDVLSGIAGALLATGLPPVEAAAVAAHLHGRAGQLAAERGPLLAGDLVRRLPEAVARLRGVPAPPAWETGGVTGAPARAEVVVDLDAIAANTAALRERVGRPLMAVVKADGYGHGLVPAARAALAGGADALGRRGASRRRWRCAPPGSPRRCWPGCTRPGRTTPPR